MTEENEEEGTESDLWIEENETWHVLGGVHLQNIERYIGRDI